MLWFAIASMMVTILHELAHACAAYVLGVRSTLYSYFADLDFATTPADPGLRTLIGVAGPSFCLVFGALAWFAFRRAGASAAGLPLLLLSVFGVGTFFGNLASVASVGDFSAAAVSLRLPMDVRYVIAAVGLVALAAVHFRAGRELIRAAPGHVGRALGTIGLVVCPAVLGTVVVILVNQPMPGAFAGARAAEGSFWLFAVLGALVTGKRAPVTPRRLSLRWADAAAALFTILVVRLMVRGIPFGP